MITNQPLTQSTALPVLIQGGMGVAVSNWQLARAVASRGMLGVVSGTGIDQVFARRLQHGDPCGSLRAAMAEFPCKETVQRTLDRYFVAEGKPAADPYRTPPMFNLNASDEHQAFCALAAFVEVWLAKHGHGNPVGINLLEKIALPNPALLMGAILAGVDFVLMGAGIPYQIPALLDCLSQCQPVRLKVFVEDDHGADGVEQGFDPDCVLHGARPVLRRPAFLAIVSSPVVAQTMLKRSGSSIEGFVIEYHGAGGHNAPPRGTLRLSPQGEPLYGERDEVDLARFRDMGLPFWLAGGQDSPEALRRAQEQGATGIQVGTLFAFCEETGLEPSLRRRAVAQVMASQAKVFTDPLASPTGFPFKVVELEGTLSDNAVYQSRKRVCDMGYLRRICRLPDGSIGARCPGEPVDDYQRKGGSLADTEGRKCLCNALLANVGLAQVRVGGVHEAALLTAGENLEGVASLLELHGGVIHAADVIEMMIGPGHPAAPANARTPTQGGTANAHR